MTHALLLLFTAGDGNVLPPPASPSRRQVEVEPYRGPSTASQTPSRDEFSSDEESLAWDVEGWEDVG